MDASYARDADGRAMVMGVIDICGGLGNVIGVLFGAAIMDTSLLRLDVLEFWRQAVIGRPVPGVLAGNGIDAVDGGMRDKRVEGGVADLSGVVAFAKSIDSAPGVVSTAFRRSGSSPRVRPLKARSTKAVAALHGGAAPSKALRHDPRPPRRPVETPPVQAHVEHHVVDIDP